MNAALGQGPDDQMALLRCVFSPLVGCPPNERARQPLLDKGDARDPAPPRAATCDQSSVDGAVAITAAVWSGASSEVLDPFLAGPGRPGETSESLARQLEERGGVQVLVPGADR